MLNIVMVAGEVSGDLLGGKLATELFSTNKVASISGIGGDTMRTANVSTLHDVSETSVVGITEVLKHYPRLRAILSTLKRHLKSTRPDLLILIDYPEFNLKLARYAKSLNIKVMFYVSPQVWAWRTGRVKKIKTCVDLMAVLFPFEVDFYTRASIPVCLVRHPLLQDVDQHYSPESQSKPTNVGLAPGSRANEIKRLFPVMLAAAELLRKEFPNIRFQVPVAPGVEISTLQALNKTNLPLEYSREDFYKTIKLCDIVAISSGTATLQTALMGKAMVVIYKISPTTYRLFGHLVKVSHISLANIILQRRAYPELVQGNATANKLHHELKTLLSDPQITARMQLYREELYNELDAGIDSRELAAKALQLVN